MTIGDEIVQSAIVLQVSRVIVKFVPGLQLPQTEAAEAQHAAAHGAAWQALLVNWRRARTSVNKLLPPRLG
jgi:hypothetical protein